MRVMEAQGGEINLDWRGSENLCLGAAIGIPQGGLLNGRYLALFPPRFALTTSSHIAGLDWASLPARSTIVDVGGEIGSMSMQLAKALGHLKFVVQDRAPVIDMRVKVGRLVVGCVVEMI